MWMKNFIFKIQHCQYIPFSMMVLTIGHCISRGTFSMSGDIFNYDLGQEYCGHLMYRGQRVSPHPTKNYLAKIIKSTKAENS